MHAPSIDVLTAFDVGSSQRLAGGQGNAHRAGAVVLKAVDDASRAGALTSGLATVGVSGPVRMARPVASRDGRWVVDGWAAWTWLEGHRQELGWEEHLEISRRFHAALADVPRSAVRPGRDRWATADHAAWNEANSRDWSDSLAALARRRVGVDLPAQFIHGDMAGNVVVHPDLGPGVIDISPYWRPGAYAEAVLVADLAAFGPDPVGPVEHHLGRHGPQLLIRAVLFRVASSPDHGADYQPLVDGLLAQR